MELYSILMNVLIFCGIILLIALTVGVIQAIIILVDVRHTSKEVKKKLYALTSVIDIFSLLMGGMEGAKNRIKKKMAPDENSIIAFVAGVKKGLKVLLRKEPSKKRGAKEKSNGKDT